MYNTASISFTLDLLMYLDIVLASTTWLFKQFIGEETEEDLELLLLKL